MAKKPSLNVIPPAPPPTAAQIRRQLLALAPTVINKIYSAGIGLEEPAGDLKSLHVLFGAIVKYRLIDDPVTMVTQAGASAEQEVAGLVGKVAAGDMTLEQANLMVNLITQRLELSEAETLRNYFRKEAANE